MSFIKSVVVTWTIPTSQLPDVTYIHDKLAEMGTTGKPSTEVILTHGPAIPGALYALMSEWKFTNLAAAEEFSSFLTTHDNAVFIASCRIITLTKSVTVVWAIPKDQLAISWGAANNTMWLHDKIAKMRADGKCSTTVWQEASISSISSQWKFTNLAAAEEFSSFLTTHDNAVFIASCDINNL
jgi:hypothetical protein